VRTLPGSQSGWRRAFLGGGLLGTGFSGVIELLQLARPSRFADIKDLGLNSLGAFIGAGIGALLLHRLSDYRSRDG
jgi:glycopeptide antibiotics resistance protein